jgi:hypothetical protein
MVHPFFALHESVGAGQDNPCSHVDPASEAIWIQYTFIAVQDGQRQDGERREY